MQIISGKQNKAIKLVLYGPEGIGKSTFASMLPSPVFIDTEGSTSHMDVKRTSNPNSWTMLLQQVDYFMQNSTEFKTLVIDTADWAERLCINQVCAFKQVKGIEDMPYGKGWVYAADEFGRLLNMLSDVVLHGMNVILTAHAQMRKFEQPDELGSYDRWELKLGKKTAPILKEWADLLLFANYKTFVINVDGQGAQKGKNKVQGGSRVMYTTHHPCWDAKNRFDLPAELPFEYAKIAHLFTKPQTAIVTPPVITPVQASESIPEPIEPPVKQSVTPDRSIAPARAKLNDLQQNGGVTDDEIQKAVAKQGYYPVSTPIENYDPQFIEGVLVAAWPAVVGLIKKMREETVPF